MTDELNIPQSDPQLVATNAEPATLAAQDPSAASSLDAHAYPSTFLASELPPSPEQLAEQLRLSKVPPDLRVPWGWTDLGLFLLFYLGSTIVLLIIAMIGASAILH